MGSFLPPGGLEGSGGVVPRSMDFPYTRKGLGRDPDPWIWGPRSMDPWIPLIQGRDSGTGTHPGRVSDTPF